jgi:pyruvate,water dikinase
VLELTAVVVQELGRRLAAVGVLPTAESARLLRFDELVAAAERRGLPADLAGRAVPAPRSLPTEFRLAADGHPVATATRPGSAVGAGGGRGVGPAWFDEDPPAGAVLLVQHLDPRLADVIPRLAGLVAETGNPLSHLAILAREHGVPTVVGVARARTRWSTGDVLDVDGDAGTVVTTGGTT